MDIILDQNITKSVDIKQDKIDKGKIPPHNLDSTQKDYHKDLEKRELLKKFKLF
jgi:hypothetical protein